VIQVNDLGSKRQDSCQIGSTAHNVELTFYKRWILTTLYLVTLNYIFYQR